MIYCEETNLFILFLSACFPAPTAFRQKLTETVFSVLKELCHDSRTFKRLTFKNKKKNLQSAEKPKHEFNPAALRRTCK